MSEKVGTPTDEQWEWYWAEKDPDGRHAHARKAANLRREAVNAGIEKAIKNGYKHPAKYGAQMFLQQDPDGSWRPCTEEEVEAIARRYSDE
jgi:hypothetical protein